MHGSYRRPRTQDTPTSSQDRGAHARVLAQSHARRQSAVGGIGKNEHRLFRGQREGQVWARAQLFRPRRPRGARLACHVCKQTKTTAAAAKRAGRAQVSFGPTTYRAE